MKFYSFVIPFVFLGYSCKKDAAINSPIKVDKTIIMAHKAGGKGFVFENSLTAAEISFAKGLGIEIDIQQSRNGTLWLFHDELITNCDINGYGRLPAYTDAEIEKYSRCIDRQFKLTKLEEVFRFHYENKLENIISLDVKSWLPTKYSNTPNYLNSLADEIVRLCKLYNLGRYVLVESETAFFLDRLKFSNIGISCYLTSFGDMEKAKMRAMKANYTGISLKYNAIEALTMQQIEDFHKLGLRIQLWTINDEETINKYENLGVDFIQTDLVD